MNILAIETSCDETAAAVVKDGRRVLSSVVSSQIKTHAPYSGVVPEIASRAHVTVVNQVIEKALAGKPKLDAIAVTIGPGLVGSLLVGKMTAETLGWIWSLPVYGVNHIEGHLLSPLLSDPTIKPPFLGLVVSGGHTELIHVPKWGDYRLLGSTKDDAAGEAFDKVAKMMGLGYPGGPVIDRLSKRGRADKSPFPRAWLPGTWNFSFSGLKTAVLYKLRTRKSWSARDKADICAGFQRSVVDVLVKKTIAAARELNLRHIVVGGGVAANSELRAELTRAAKSEKMKLTMAPPELCTDNAAMIASAAYFKIKSGLIKKSEPLRVQPQLRIPSVKIKK